MSKPFLLGLQSYIPEAPFLSTKTLYERVGENTGNLAFQFAVHAQVLGLANVLPWTASPESINAAGEVAVLPCANQLGKHADMSWAARILEQTSVRLVAVGLGGQFPLDDPKPYIPPGTLNWVRCIAERNYLGQPNISVRGMQTFSALEKCGFGSSAVVLGCPTLFINPDPSLGHKIAKKFGKIERVAVAAGHERWAHLAKLESSLADIVTRTGGSYVGQSAFQMIALTRGDLDVLTVDQLLACRDYIRPALSLHEFIDWVRIHGQVFFDVPGWMEHYRHFDMVVGTRIHGVMLALQAGTPAMCIAHDSRTLELCQTMLVPHVEASRVVNGMTLEDLPRYFQFDPAAFDANRMRLGKRYVEFLVSNSLRASNELTSSFA